MSRDAYTSTNSADRSRSGDLITHPPDDDDLSGFLTSQPRRNQSGARVNKTQQPAPDDEDLSGCLTSGFLKRKIATPVISQNQPPAKPEIATAAPVEEESESGWLYLN